MVASDEVILQVRGLSKNYYGVIAVDDLDLSITRGSITGLIGPNGSGKSTTIDCISGFQPADAGQWSVEGQNLTGLSAHTHALAGVTRTFQTVRAYDELSLIDNMRLACQEHDRVGWLDSLRGSRRVRTAEAAATERARELLETVALSEYAEAPAEILSYGQRKLLAIAAVMMARPKVVMLDEPVAGVNPTMIHRIEDVIRKINADGVTLLIVEHNIDFVMNISQHIIVLDSGRKLAEGDPKDIRADPRVLDAYLGVEIAEHA